MENCGGLFSVFFVLKTAFCKDSNLAERTSARRPGQDVVPTTESRKHQCDNYILKVCIPILNHIYHSLFLLQKGSRIR